MVFNTYAMLDGKLAKWEVTASSYAEAIAVVRKEARLPTNKSVLISVYLGPTQRELF